jgi:hypothetical protein
MDEREQGKPPPESRAKPAAAAPAKDAAAREDRLAAALRANLRRRKTPGRGESS